ncbi:Uncharacterised protein [Pseudomonas aeruginosa]|jgi:hypothetical protein|nr:Uncharacterised protein [Pseudomonas aeruginosa]
MLFLVIPAATVIVEARACLNEEGKQPRNFKLLQPE